MYTLRGYQDRAVSDCMDYIRGPLNLPVVAVLPTAAGKSLIVNEVAKRVGEKVLIIQPSIELLKQNYKKAEELSCIGMSIYSAGAGEKEFGYLTYVTLGSIKKEAKKFKALGFKTVLIDECHTGVNPSESSMFTKFIKALDPKKVIGFTATPYRLNSTLAGTKLTMLNRVIPGYFKKIIHVTQIKEMIDQGFWSDIRYETYEFDNSGLILNSSGAEFTETSVSQAVQSQGVNNNILMKVLNMQELGYTRILVFTDSVPTAKKFSEHVKNSAYITSNTKPKERERIISEFKSGKIHVLFNYNILATGFDYPELQSVIMGRPTNSLAIFYQIVGRGVRIHPAKKWFHMIDFCGNVERFGRVEEQEIINYENHGWAVFCKGELVTDVYLNGGYSVTKDDIDNKFDSDNTELETEKMWFGKYKGKTLPQIMKANPGYFTFMLNNFDFNTPKMYALKRDIGKLLKSDALK